MAREIVAAAAATSAIGAPPRGDYRPRRETTIRSERDQSGIVRTPRIPPGNRHAECNFFPDTPGEKKVTRSWKPLNREYHEERHDQVRLCASLTGYALKSRRKRTFRPGDVQSNLTPRTGAVAPTSSNSPVGLNLKTFQVDGQTLRG